MGIFDGMDKAVVQQGYRYICAGNWELEIQKCIVSKTRQGEEFFVSDFKVVDSTAEDFPPGSEVSWMVMKRHDAFLGNVKGFIAAAMNAKPSEVDEGDAEHCISEDQPLMGKTIYGQAYDKKTKVNQLKSLMEAVRSEVHVVHRQAWV